MIYSDGDAAIGGQLDANLLATGAATTLNNLGATINVTGNLDLQAQAIHNVREGLVVTTTTTVLAPVQLNQPAWWSNGKNATSDIRSTSNYQADEIYYLNPADILSDTPYVTPDGYVGRMRPHQDR